MPVRFIETKKGPSWWADVCYGGQRFKRRPPVNTKSAAKALESRMRHELLTSGKLHDFRERDTCPKFCDFSMVWFKEYVQTENKPSETRSKLSILNASLNPHFGNKQLDEICEADIQAYKSKELQRGITKKTINNRLSCLRRCLRIAVRRNVIKTMPVIDQFKTQLTEVKFLSEQQAKDLVLAMDWPVLKWMMQFALNTGLRFCELIALEWKDIDMERGIITINRARVGKHTGTPKNGRIRHIPVNNAVREVLMEMLQKESKSGYVFNRNGEYIKYWRSLVHLQLAAKRTGIDFKIGWHTLRHTFASWLASRGASMRSIQELLGHSSMTMTLRYAHLEPNVLRETVDLLERPREASVPGVSIEENHPTKTVAQK